MRGELFLKRNNKMKTVIIAIVCILVLWMCMGLIDYFRVSKFEKPIFCFLDVDSAIKDGGSGKYIGPGYSFDIIGRFMPEDERPGVTSYTYYIGGIKVAADYRP